MLFIGVRDDGTPEGRQENLESIQRSLGKKLAAAYPPVPHYPRVLASNGLRFLAVIIPGSAERPHFAGPSYIRDGSDSIPASPNQFTQLIASRSAKVRLILEWKDREVTVRKWEDPWMPLGTLFGGDTRGGPYEPTRSACAATLRDCNPFF